MTSTAAPTTVPKPDENARADQIADIVFRDTLTARMLRILWLQPDMLQADFMREYMRRCNRKPTTNWRGEVGDKANTSSFSHNFGRFLHSASGRNPRPTIMRRTAIPKRKRGNVLMWLPPPVSAIVRAMSHGNLQLAFERLESAQLSPLETDYVATDLVFWLVTLQAEIDRRNPLKAARTTRRAA